MATASSARRAIGSSRRAAGTWLLAAALALPACAGRAARPRTAVDDGRPEPIALTLERADGRAVELGAYRGRAVLVVAFLMDDLSSQAMLRHTERLARAYPDDLAVVAISGDRHAHAQHRELLGVFARVLELSRTEVVLADDAVRDGVSPLGPIERTPTTFLVNRAGVIARRLEGYLGPAELDALVAPALPRGGAAPP